MKIKCPSCFFKYDVDVNPSQTEVSCVCPRCGSPFTYQIPKESVKTQVEAPKDTEEKVSKTDEISVEKPKEKRNTRKCSECGAVIDSALRICPKCGNPMPAFEKKDAEVKTRVCAECGASFDSSLFVCPECGAPISGYSFCPECNSLVRKASKACPNCGSPLQTTDKNNQGISQPQTCGCQSTQSTNSYDDNENNNNVWMYVGIFLVIVITIIWISVSMSNNKNSQENSIVANDSAALDSAAVAAPDSAALDSTAAAPEESSSNTASIPSWLVGSWEGDFNNPNLGDFHISITISEDGEWNDYVSYTSGKEAREEGRITSYQSNELSVQFNGESSETTFAVNENNETFSLGEGAWLTKMAEAPAR